MLGASARAILVGWARVVSAGCTRGMAPAQRVQPAPPAILGTDKPPRFSAEWPRVRHAGCACRLRQWQSPVDRTRRARRQRERRSPLYRTWRVSRLRRYEPRILGPGYPAQIQCAHARHVATRWQHRLAQLGDVFVPECKEGPSQLQEPGGFSGGDRSDQQWSAQ